MHLSDQSISQPAGVPVNQNNLEKKGTSDDTKTLITVLLLIFVYPIGFFFMWFWAKWKTWVKILVTIPFFLVVVYILIFINFYNNDIEIKKIRDSKRKNDIIALSKVLNLYIIENKGHLPFGLTTICPQTQIIGQNGFDFASVIAIPTILGDPKQHSFADRGYEICISDPATNRITISAPKAEGGTPISITR